MSPTTEVPNGTVTIDPAVVADLVVPFRMVETLIPNSDDEYITEALRSANARYQLLIAYDNATELGPVGDGEEEIAHLVARKDPVLTERMDAFDWSWNDVINLLDDENWFFDREDIEPAFLAAIESKQN